MSDIMLFAPKKPKITRQQQLAARPVRRDDAKLESADDGGKIKVPLRSRGWLFRVPEGATKTFELDALGLFVWDACDGRTSVQQIIRRLAKRYNLSLREAEVSTLTFMNVLLKKGLLAMPLSGEKKEKAEQ